ncbi:MAG TPA: hypothetical protein VFD04_18580 [Actinomycetes bacterium]|jgi:hypothetical protein|nr:hypothetical protein [Actinomycetes bacterium]
MGFVIWFKLEVAGAAPDGPPPLRVSNDVFSGDYVLDADIRVELVAGAAASSFTAVLANLPADVADALKSRHREGGKRQPLQATISLGYFDDPATQANPVLRGVVTSLRTRVNGDGLLETELRGTELAGYWLLNTPVQADQRGARPLGELVEQVARQANENAGGQATVTVPVGSNLRDVTDFTLRNGSGLEALRTIAEAAQAPLVVADGSILIGETVGQRGTAVFSAADNIVSLDRLQEEPEDQPPPGPPGDGAAAAPGANGQARTSVDLTVLGDPAVRVGQAAQLLPADPKDTLPGPLRVERARHTFSTRRGYTCDVTVAVAKPGERAKRLTGAHGVVDRIRDLAETVREQRPALDVGQVAGYDDGAGGKHLATLRYGQSPPADAVAPSVEVAVDREPQLHGKPLASPFAFHKCGLVVPVLPGMRALLAHNRGLVNDAVVAGFLWSEQPRLEPPQNAAGDWWLCLPTGLDGQGLPTGKGVNDLTDKAGLRVIQAKGLRITVGEGKLPDVGKRPEVPGDLGGKLLIEHEGGTTITVAGDGAVTLDTGGKDITIKSGNASITLSGGTVKLRGSAVEVS